MKKWRAKDIIVRIVMAVQILFLLYIGAKFVTRQVLIEKFGMDNAWTRLFFAETEDKQEDTQNNPTIGNNEKIKIDWISLYPYTNGGPIMEEDNRSRLQKLTDSIKEKEASLEKYTNVMLPGYQTFVEAEKTIEHALGWEITSYVDYDSVTKLEDGYLTTYNREQDISYQAEAVIGLSEYCKSQNVNFLYVQAPFKVSEKQDESISGKVDFSNQNANALLEQLEQNQVDYLDLRESMYDMFANYHEAFYITDHHWKPQTGLWATGVLADVLEAKYGLLVEAEKLQAQNFEEEAYLDLFLGSWGKRVTLSQTKPEDFALLYPRYDTDFQIIIPERGMDVRGGFSKLYNYQHVEKVDYYNLNPYEAYIWGNNAQMLIHNYNVENGSRVLLVKDSFANSVAPFLACGVEDVDILDVRYFTGSLETYIQATKPDVVIVLYNAAMLGDGSKGYQTPFNFK